MITGDVNGFLRTETMQKEINNALTYSDISMFLEFLNVGAINIIGKPEDSLLCICFIVLHKFIECLLLIFG